MKKYLLFMLFTSSLYSNELLTLLNDYENNSEMSKKTIDENIGHLRVYTQDDIKKMQYNKLSDLLKELRLLNFETNRYGTKTLLNTGFKADVSTSVKLFINNHEVSSLYTLSAFTSWDDLPLDFISHIEVYNGNSSFSVGSEPGANYIKIFTLDPKKFNSTKLTTSYSSEKDRAIGLTQGTTLENDWSYLFYSGIQRNIEEKNYNNSKLFNNSTKQYLFLNLNKESSQIDMAYTDVSKENFIGYSIDSNPDDGDMKTKDYYISYSDSFLYDNSLKTVFSIDVNNRKYDEINNDYGIMFFNSTSYKENINIKKYNSHITKEFSTLKNSLLIGTDLIYKERDTKNRTADGVELNLSNFDIEKTLSLFLEDRYQINENLYLSANAKFDKYNRENLEDLDEKLLRVGAIYLPTTNLGFKLFLAKSYIPPTYFYEDFKDRSKDELTSQQLKYISLENVYAIDSHKISLTVGRVVADDMIILGTNGFYNINKEVQGDSLILNYDYTLSSDSKYELNYYITNTNQTNTNSYEGGYIKYMSSYFDVDYFSSVIYKKGYDFLGTQVKNGYDLSLGTTYNISKNLTLSLKAENLLNKAIKTSYINYSDSSVFQLENQDRVYTMTLKWLF